MELMPGYKHSDAGVIPEDWEVFPLSREIEGLDAGVSVNSIDEDLSSYGNNCAVLKTSAIAGGQFMPHENKVIASRDVYRARLTPRKDSIIISRMNTPDLVGDCGYVFDDYPNLFLPDRLWMTRSRKGSHFCIKWLNYLLSSKPYKARIKGFATGTSGSMKNIAKDSLLSMRIPYPPPHEQHAIAQALSDVDALLATLDQMIAKKRDLKQAAMQQLLAGGIQLAGFNRKWLEVPLGEIVKPQKGQLITTKTIVPGDIPVIAGGKQPAYFHASANRYGKTITVSASGASAGYVALHAAPIFASDCSTISESEKYCIEFIYYALQLRQEEIYAAQTGGAQPHIQPKDLAPILIKIPEDVTEQAAIASVLSDMDTETAELEARRNKTSDIKQAMMQELLTGKTRLV